MQTWLMSLPYLDIFSGLVDMFQKATSSGDYDASKLKNAAEALQQIQPYLHFNDAIGQIVSFFKWGIIKFLYGLANAASEIATQSLNFRSLLTSSKLDPLVKNGVMAVVTVLMTITLIIAAIKYGTDYHAPKLKNVFFQLFISAFLIFNIQPLMQTLVDFSTGAYKDFTNVKGAKGTSNLPYKMVQNNSNDLFVLVANNFGKIKGSGDTGGFKGLDKDKDGDVKTQKNVRYGSFQMPPSDFNKATAGNLSTTITPDIAKSMAEKKDENKWAWNPDNLRYMLQPSGGSDQNGSGSFIATKINSSSLPFFNIFNGGYERYSVDFFPVAVSLIAIAVAFLLVAWVSIKAFLNLAIMQVIAVIVGSTDVETGERTKAAVEDILQSAIVIAFQGLELAFYQIVVTWMTDGDNGIKNNPYLFCVAMIAATAMLFEGSQKVAKFFGVDTGLQNGWQSMVKTAAAGKYLLHGSSDVAKAGMAATHKAKTGLQMGVAGAAGFGAGLNEAVEQDGETSFSGFNRAVESGYNQARAMGSIKDDFIANGGSRHQFNKALRRGQAKPMAQAMGKRMTKANGGLTDNEYNSIYTPEKYYAEGEQPPAKDGAYGNLALKHAQDIIDGGSHKAKNGSDEEVEIIRDKKGRPVGTRTKHSSTPESDSTNDVENSQEKVFKSGNNSMQAGGIKKEPSESGNSNVKETVTENQQERVAKTPVHANKGGRKLNNVLGTQPIQEEKGSDLEQTVTRRPGHTRLNVKSAPDSTEVNDLTQPDTPISDKHYTNKTKNSSELHRTAGNQRKVNIESKDTTTINQRIKHDLKGKEPGDH